MSTPELIEHFFRHEYGGLVAILSRRVGVQHIEAVEDAVQSALMKALDAWLPAVNKILYLLFTEGYLASHMGNAIRRELCDEAIRLTAILAQHPIGQVPQTFALLALMHLHVARMTSRQDASGGLLLLEEQDRALWDQQRIQVGLEWLAKSAYGDKFSRYHAEAGIAAEHCLASSFEDVGYRTPVAANARVQTRPGDCPQPGDIAVDGGRVPAPRQGGGGELAGSRGDRLHPQRESAD